MPTQGKASRSLRGNCMGGSMVPHALGSGIPAMSAECSSIKNLACSATLAEGRASSCLGPWGVGCSEKKGRWRGKARQGKTRQIQIDKKTEDETKLRHDEPRQCKPILNKTRYDKTTAAQQDSTTTQYNQRAPGTPPTHTVMAKASNGSVRRSANSRGSRFLRAADACELNGHMLQRRIHEFKRASLTVSPITAVTRIQNT